MRCNRSGIHPCNTETIKSEVKLSLAVSVSKGLSRNSASVLIRLICEFGVKIGLATLLLPSDYGIYTFSISIVMIGLTVAGLGIYPCLVQRKKDERSNIIYQRSYSLVIISSLVVFTILQLSCAFLGVLDFVDSKIITAIRISSFVFFISPHWLLPNIILSRSLRLDKIANAEIIFSVLFFCCSFILAMLGAGYLTLITGWLIGQISKTVYLIMMVPTRPLLSIDLKKVSRVVRDSKFYLFSSLFAIIRTRADVFLIGISIGFDQLGVYALAFAITDSVQALLSSIVNKTLFPVYCKLQENKQQLQNLFLRCVKYCSLIMLPFYTLLFFGAEFFINNLMEEGWSEAAKITQILCISSMIFTIGGYPNEYFNASGRPELTMKIALICYCLVGLPTLLIFANLGGIHGVAWSLVSHHTTLRIYQIVKLKEIYDINHMRILRALMPGICLASFLGVSLDFLLG